MNRKISEFFKLPETVRIPFLGGLWYKLIAWLENRSILKEKIPINPLNSELRDEIVTVSLTSYPARIKYVHLAIKSLMLQTYKPDRIVLWLAEEQFPTRKLPKELTDLQEYGLDIIWMHDIYGHKKYFYPVINQADNEVIITYDDDIIYSPNSIKRLMQIHEKFPRCLVCDRGQTFDQQYYNNPGKWKTRSSIGVKKPTYGMNPSPGGGCLIPKGAFCADAVCEGKIRELAYKNDDLWYMFMCAQNGTKMIKTRKNHRTFTTINGSQGEQMAFENILQNRNAVILQGLKQAYPIAWERIVYDKD